MSNERGSEAAELLEVTDRNGRGTGVIRPRGLIHLEGAWHRTRTVWALLIHEPAGPSLLLQKRGFQKGAWPGRLDASTAGHLTPNEVDQWREVQEELGVRPGTGTAMCLGTRRNVRDLGGGRIDREVQELWLWRCPHTMCQFHLPTPEVAAVVVVLPGILRCLLGGELGELVAPVRWAAPGRAAQCGDSLRIDASQFVPGEAKYVAHIAELAQRCAAGERDLHYDVRLDPPALDVSEERSSGS